MNLSQPFVLRKVITINRFSNKKVIDINFSFKSRLIRVEANFRNAKANWNKVGWLKQFNRGNTHSNGHLVTFGSQFILLSNVSPYTLKFTPVNWLPDGNIKIWEFRGPLTDDELDQFHQFITQGNPNLMPTISPGDVRGFKKMLAEQAAMLTEQAAQLATTGAKLVTIETSMVIERKFTVLKAAFTASEDVWVYDLVHDMNALTPSVEIYDTNPLTGKAKDIQLLQAVGVDENTLQIELSQAEYDGANFPLNVAIQATNSPVVFVPAWEAVPGGVGELRFNAGKVEYSLDMGVTVDRQLFPDLIAVEAFLGADNWIYAKLDSGIYTGSQYGTWTRTDFTEAAYNGMKANPSSIGLSYGPQS